MRFLPYDPEQAYLLPPSATTAREVRFSHGLLQGRASAADRFPGALPPAVLSLPFGDAEEPKLRRVQFHPLALVLGRIGTLSLFLAPIGGRLISSQFSQQKLHE
jgi:hypothetical protein